MCFRVSETCVRSMQLCFCRNTTEVEGEFPSTIFPSEYGRELFDIYVHRTLRSLLSLNSDRNTYEPYTDMQIVPEFRGVRVLLVR